MSPSRAPLASLAEAVLKGAVDPNTAKAVGYLISLERSIADKEGTEARVEAMEAVVITRN